MRWLEREACGKHLCVCITGCLLVNFVYTFCAIQILYFFGIDVPLVREGGKIPILTPAFPLVLFGVAFFEEAIFRLPLAVFVGIRLPLGKVLIGALVLSLIFGVTHGGIYHIFFQGVGGFTLSILFLKCGGAQGNWAKALTVTGTTHFLYNGALVILAIMEGAKSF